MNDKAYPWQVLSVTSLGVLLVTLNLGTLKIALPEVSAYFHAGAVVTSWVLLSYMLFNTVLILVFGKLADIYGRRTLYLIGLAEFTAVSFLCGLSPNVGILIGLRILGLGGLIFAFSEGGVAGWSSLPVTAGLLLFAFSGVCFVWWERRVKHPTVDFVMFHHWSYAMANLATFFNSLGRSSVVLLIALYFQVMNKENTFTAGLNVLPVTVGMIVASPAAGMLSAKYSTRILSTSGLLGTCIGMLVLVWSIGEHASNVWIWIGQGLVGIGTGLFMTPNTKSIMLSVPNERRGMANGLRSMLQNMGAVLSTALSLMIVTSVLPPHLKDAIYAGSRAVLTGNDRQLIASGFQLAFSTMLLLTALAIAASYLRDTGSMKD